MIESISQFVHQGGYAGFVWGAFGMTFALLLAEIWQLRRSRRTILVRVGRLVRLRHPRQSTSPAASRPAAAETRR
jgi:heme exporter protein D